MFEWNNSYAIGIASIDAQHRTLFDLSAKLHQAMSAGQGKAAVGPILERLLQYTQAHFAHEERLMRIHDYPDFVAHKAQHDALTKQVADFSAKFKSGQGAITVQLLQFLKNWLVNHIKGTDMKYVPHLAAKAVA
jgi:hemerythrin